MGNRKIYKKEELPEKLSQLSCYAKDITGQKFDRLTVLYPSILKANDGSILWVCVCDCNKNNYILTTSSNLRRKSFHSCGSEEDNNYVQREEMNKRYNELNGKIFNSILVLNFDHCENKKIYLKCECLNCGNTFITRKDAILSEHTTSCGCIKSKGEMKINEILLKNNINFKKEYTFEDCKDIDLLRFDFALFTRNKLQCLIEYQGKQHYEYENKGWNTIEHFNLLQKHDKMKKEYCKNNNIKLYIINYNEDINKRMEEIINGIQC